MNFRDVLKLSLDNLWRRRWRTVLTTLGVAIGTISVIIMLSLGYGLKGSLEEEINSYGSVNDIVLTYNGDSEDMYFFESRVEEFEQLDYVKAVTPELTCITFLYEGKWEVYAELRGLPKEKLQEIEVGEGRIPDSDSGQLELIIGNQMILEVHDVNTGEYPYWDNNGELADMDFLGGNVRTVFFQNSFDGNYSLSREKKIPIVGMVAGDENTYGTYCYGAMCDIDILKSYLEKNYRGQVIPGQPVDKNGAPYKELVYTSLTLSITDSRHVEEAVEYFRSMGYIVSSNAEWLEENNNIFSIVQLILGGIGAVALLVAAIGITNTITMSIYERRKEIGIMKVLGCDIENIGAMFVTEAGFIGFIGGAVGVALSYMISYVINMVGGDMMAYAIGVSGKLSVIPMWLPFVGVGFAILIGVMAGYFPSRKATKISALAAIRNE